MIQSPSPLVDQHHPVSNQPTSSPSGLIYYCAALFDVPARSTAQTHTSRWTVTLSYAPLVAFLTLLECHPAHQLMPQPFPADLCCHQAARLLLPSEGRQQPAAACSPLVMVPHLAVQHCCKLRVAVELPCLHLRVHDPVVTGLHTAHLRQQEKREQVAPSTACPASNPSNASCHAWQ